MPTKTTSKKKSGTKTCPYCANEIKEKAIKCQYCWEFLPKEEKEDEHVISRKEGINESSFKWSKLPIIKAWNWVKIWCIIVFIRLGLAFLSWMFEWGLEDSEVFAGIDVLISLFSIIMIIVWCNIGYKYLLDKKIDNLHFNSTWWPTWWWICPIAWVFVPYQTVKDIHKISGKKNAIVGWRWACFLLTTIFLSLSDKGIWDEEWYISLIAIWFLIAFYVLTINIVNHVSESLSK